MRLVDSIYIYPATVISDTLLIVLPIWILHTAKLDSGLRARLVAVFLISVAITVAAITHAAVSLIAGGVLGLLCCALEVTTLMLYSTITDWYVRFSSLCLFVTPLSLSWLWPLVGVKMTGIEIQICSAPLLTWHSWSHPIVKTRLEALQLCDVIERKAVPRFLRATLIILVQVVTLLSYHYLCKIWPEAHQQNPKRNINLKHDCISSLKVQVVTHWKSLSFRLKRPRFFQPRIQI